MLEFDFEALSALGLKPAIAGSATGLEVEAPAGGGAWHLSRVTEVHRETIVVHDGRDERSARALPWLARALQDEGTALSVGDWVLSSIDRNGEATRHYSLHTTGWAFDVLRDYRSRRQALAFQFVLDRLRSLNAIAWVREPRAIHVTVAPAPELTPLLDRVNIEP